MCVARRTSACGSGGSVRGKNADEMAAEWNQIQVRDNPRASRKALLIRSRLQRFIMVALCNRADHYIFAVLFLSSILFFLA